MPEALAIAWVKSTVLGSIHVGSIAHGFSSVWLGWWLLLVVCVGDRSVNNGHGGRSVNSGFCWWFGCRMTSFSCGDEISDIFHGNT